MQPAPLRAVQWCSLLFIGIALGVYGVAISDVLQRHLHPGTSMVHTLVVVIGAVLAGGLMLPASAARLLASPGGIDASESWRFTRFQLVSGAALIVAAGAVLAMAALQPALARVYQVALARFHWTTATLVGLDVVLVAVHTAVPVGLMAVAMHCDFRRAVALGSPPGPPVAAVVMGLGLGLALGVAWAPAPIHLLIAVAVLLLGAAVVGTLLASGQRTTWADTDVPSRASNGTARLYIALVWCVVLVSLYITLLWRIEREIDVGHVVAGCALCLGLGVLASRLLPEAVNLPYRIAQLTLAAAAGSMGTALVAGFLPLAAGAPLWRSTAVGIGLLVTPVVVGMIVGTLADGLAERSTRPRPRTLCALASGCALAHIVLMPEILDRWQPYDWLIIITLAWFVTGGLLLTLDPTFTPRRRWPAIAALAVLITTAAWMMPAQAPAWAGLWQRLAQHSNAHLMTTTSGFEAARWLEALPDAALDGGRDTSLSGILRRLRLDRTTYAAVSLTVGPASDAATDDRLLEAVLAEIRRHLLPDGVLVVGERGGDPASPWRDHLDGPFASWRSVDCAGGACWVAGVPEPGSAEGPISHADPDAR